MPEEVLTELVEGHHDYSPDDFTFEGEHDSFEDLAWWLVEESGDLNQVPEWLRGHIDYASIARDLDCGGMYEIRHNGSGYYWTIH